jgi:hypothetical protein
LESEINKIRNQSRGQELNSWNSIINDQDQLLDLISYNKVWNKDAFKKNQNKLKQIKEREKFNVNVVHFIPNNQYDYSADTDEFAGIGEITNKISTIKIKNNNINHIDVSTANVAFDNKDYMYSQSFAHTPQKIQRDNNYGSNDSHRMNTINTSYPGLHLLKGSIISQTTHGSSNNKKVYIDSDMEGIDIDEFNADKINIQKVRIPTCESIESNNNMYENRRFFSSSFTDRNFYLMHNNVLENAFSINSNQKRIKNKKHTNSDIPKPGLSNIINLDHVTNYDLDYYWL